MSVLNVQPEAPKPGHYAVAGAVGAGVVLLTYLVGLLLAFAVAFRVTDPFVDDADDVRGVVLPLLAVAALLAGFLGAWLAGWVVRRKHATARQVWTLVAAIVVVMIVLAVPGLWQVPLSLFAHLVGLAAGATGGALLALRQAPGARR